MRGIQKISRERFNPGSGTKDKTNIIDILYLVDVIIMVLLTIMVLNKFGLKGLFIYLIILMATGVIGMDNDDKYAPTNSIITTVLQYPEYLKPSAYVDERTRKFKIPMWNKNVNVTNNITKEIIMVVHAFIFILFMWKSGLVSVENMNPLNLLKVDYNLKNIF